MKPHTLMLTDEEVAECKRLEEESMLTEPDMVKDRYLHMILHAYKPGKMQWSEFDLALVCKILRAQR